MGLGGSWSRAVAAYLEDELSPIAIGRDALDPGALWHRLWSPNKARMRGGLGAWALSALDIACWDVVGKAAGRSIHALLGGDATDVPVYGSGGWHSLSDAELVAECERYAALGITAYKYKIGAPRDRERTALLRRTMGDGFTLLADANQGFDVPAAIEASRMLADFGVAWLEEPVVADSPDDLVAVAREAAVPIAAGENVYFRWGFHELCARGAVTLLQPDVTRVGGISEFRRVADLADAYGLALSSHLWHELSISLVGASPRAWAVEYADLLPAGLLTRTFDVIGGRLRIPDAPGHGVELAPDALARYGG
jgi:L-alanine-DL-glutamate epimerase-like enolase superfamily enzyme